MAVVKEPNDTTVSAPFFAPIKETGRSLAHRPILLNTVCVAT